MTDIVEQARAVQHPACKLLVNELADEIERLTAEHKTWHDCYDNERRNNERLRAALEPFARNVDANSLSGALGHITREHLWEARRAMEPKP